MPSIPRVSCAVVRGWLPGNIVASIALVFAKNCRLASSYLLKITSRNAEYREIWEKDIANLLLSSFANRSRSDPMNSLILVILQDWYRRRAGSGSGPFILSRIPESGKNHQNPDSSFHIYLPPHRHHSVFHFRNPVTNSEQTKKIPRIIMLGPI